MARKSNTAAQAEPAVETQSFKAMWQIRRDGETIEPGGDIVLDRAGYDELASTGAIFGTWHEEPPAAADTDTAPAGTGTDTTATGA